MLETILQHSLISPGQKVLVGLSGGPDSWALMLALQRLSPKLNISLRAVCVDHGLRAESAEEAADVAIACEARGVACAVVRVDVGSKRTAHVSWQDAARRARLEALAIAAGNALCDVVALGHNANDQAETVLFRIVRGTGLRGLAGIPYKRDVFVRPLLDVTRAEIERFIARANVAVVSDPSNLNSRYTRVRFRQQWLPALAKENPRIVEALLSLAAEARQNAGKGLGPEVSGTTLSRRQAHAVGRLVHKGGTSAVSVEGGRVQVSYGTATFVPSTTVTDPQAEPCVVQSFEKHHSVTWGRKTLVFSTAPPVPATDRGTAIFDREKIVWPLTVRSRKAGDRLRPRGGKGSRKLQDLLVDAKVPQPDRAALPVVVDGAGVLLFVPGIRPSEAAKPTASTRAFLAIGIKNFVISPK